MYTKYCLFNSRLSIKLTYFISYYSFLLLRRLLPYLSFHSLVVTYIIRIAILLGRYLKVVQLVRKVQVKKNMLYFLVDFC